MKKILETQRLYLRELTEEDYGDLCDILQNKEVMYAYEHAFCDDEVKDWYDRQITRYSEHGFGLWAVIEKSENRFVGQCGLSIQKIKEGNGLETTVSRPAEYLEIGYLLKMDYWHMGFATEAAIGCREYAFGTLKAPAVYSIIRDSNIASQNVAKRVGMKVMGETVKHYYDMDMPHYIYGIENPALK
jgi:RimJ/RimL family protein N-acetyltransferase